MTVSPVSSTKGPTLADNAPITTTGKKTTLDSNDFMRLLSVQFQQQDPMKPMDDTAFIAQMAQFSSLQQSQTFTSEIIKLRSDQQLATANSYLGKQVTVDDGKKGTDSGVVSGIQIDSDGPRLVIGDFTYPISAVLQVEPAPVSTTTTPPANAGGS